MDWWDVDKEKCSCTGIVNGLHTLEESFHEEFDILWAESWPVCGKRRATFNRTNKLRTHLMLLIPIQKTKRNDK
jgi:hypothetical protein